MDCTEHVERFVESIELVLIEVDRSNAGRDATSCGRSLEQGESGECSRGLVELAAANVYLAEKRESAHMVGVEHCHVLEGPEGAFWVATFAKRAGLFPREFLDFVRV